MRIEKGIKGIRKTINDNKAGWHLVDGDLGSKEYIVSTFLEILQMEKFNNKTLIWVGGNVLMIRQSK